MRSSIIILLSLYLVSHHLNARTYKFEAIRVVGASYDRPVADIKVDTVIFPFHRDGSLTISDASGLKLYFTRSRAMELCDLTDAASRRVGSNILSNRIEQGFTAGEVLAKGGYNLEIGVPSVSDLGKTMLFAGMKPQQGDMAIFYTVTTSGTNPSALIFVNNLVNLNIIFERWKAKHYY